jgi:hypothetical protein
MPKAVQGEVGSAPASSVASGSAVVGSASSVAPDVASLIEKAIAKLPPEMVAEAKDPKRKAKSRDPG